MTVLALFDNIQCLEKALDSLWKMLDGHFWVLSLELAQPAGLRSKLEQQGDRTHPLRACSQSWPAWPDKPQSSPIQSSSGALEKAAGAEPTANPYCPPPMQLSAEEWQRLALCLRQGGCALLLQPQTPKNRWISLFHEAGAQQVMTMNGGRT